MPTATVSCTEEQGMLLMVSSSALATLSERLKNIVALKLISSEEKQSISVISSSLDVIGLVDNFSWTCVD